MFPPLVSLWRPRRAGNPALRNVPRPHVPPIRQAAHPCGDKDDLSPNNCPGSQLVILFVDCNKIVARQSIVSCDNFTCNYSILQIILSLGDFAGLCANAVAGCSPVLMRPPSSTTSRAPVPARTPRWLLYSPSSSAPRQTLYAPVPPAYFTSFSLGDFVGSSPGLTLKPSL